MNKLTKKLTAVLTSTLLLATAAWASEAPAPAVKTEQVKQTKLSPSANLLGTVYSRSNIAITAGVNGQLTWLVEPGTFVSKGDVLVKMDTLPLELMQLEQQAQIKREKINIGYLKRELQRLEALKANNNAAEFQLDQTKSKYELAMADLEIAELKLKQIHDQLARAEINAPFAGVITERLEREGSDVNRSQVLLRMLDTENLQVRMFVPVRYMPYLNNKSQLQVFNEQYQTIARIQAIIPAADQRSQSFELRLELDADSVSHWTAGQLVKVEIPVQADQETLAIHRDALILRKNQTYVMKIDKQNIAHKMTVNVGQGQGDWVAIEGELSEGDRVAVRGAERLRDGQKVNVQSKS
ncbi:efflux RND transporter periplasmic adaptor subunit [Thalassotalea sp. HSM 43]|uniref:efflux RND transporter periplasmic adaptor subunit n=1 Tax=Thalassotalea sp. HSM 43 TaxID=2552945 RepID=UPI001080C84B|nr:efflux RND transporter periplasmic adaptor subunit [Thalassotalea sp. HSM 43]QBY05519.1 efflux RND transporter periplasmic adaptor subunit [Thalassotalea sp. HSM 43]